MTYLKPIRVIAFTLSSLALAVANGASTNVKHYHEESLNIYAGGVTIGGTLLKPVTHKHTALVVMSSGSGPQDRDETLFGFKIFKVIAEHLAGNGIATFRYDDRGVGESTGDFVNSTIDDLSNDVASILKHFSTDETHRYESFILFGHSQGGIVAGKVAANNPSVQALILMASPGVPLVDLVLFQVANEYVGKHLPAELIDAELSAHLQLMEAIRDNRAISHAVQAAEASYLAILKALPENAGADVTQLQEKAKAHAEELEVIYALPSLTSFLFYNATEDLSRLTIPVLALFAENDQHVTILQNQPNIQKALETAGVPYRFQAFPKANHFFQEAPTGRQSEYEKLEKRFVDGFLTTLSDWIYYRSQASAPSIFRTKSDQAVAEP
jgi:pimeloyl-ACP methyl ester carboxylesterase